MKKIETAQGDCKAAQEESKIMKLRSSLMQAIEQYIKQLGITQAQAAKLFGVTQPRISDLIRGKINLFALDALVNMATTAGMQIEMRILGVQNPS